MFNILLARILISSRFPIGVETIYKPASKLIIVIIFIFIVSCAPVNNDLSEKVLIKNHPNESEIQEKAVIKKENLKNITKKQKQLQFFLDKEIINEIEIILPQFKNANISQHLINSFELSVYKKEIKNVSFNINRYRDLKDLEILLQSKLQSGKIFIGTLSSEASRLIKNYCKEGILFFSFSSDKSLANDCTYLINFFPEDDLTALFNFLPDGSKVALLYPENYYGYNINTIIDPIVAKSNSIIINRSSYKEDLTNARESIKELSKYELRKYELDRQKKILESKEDEMSKKILKKIKKFETTDNVDFTHIILPDYSIRLLEIAPLLPFYDVDPSKIQFVGTGVWDDKAFFDEPALQGAIFPGIEESERNFFFDIYQYIYKERPIRTSTIPYDLIGIISYIIDNKMTLGNAKDLLNNGNIKFEGIDGKFFFNNNIIFRELDILQINKGSAIKLE